MIVKVQCYRAKFSSKLISGWYVGVFEKKNQAKKKVLAMQKSSGNLEVMDFPDSAVNMICFFRILSVP